MQSIPKLEIHEQYIPRTQTLVPVPALILTSSIKVREKAIVSRLKEIKFGLIYGKVATNDLLTKLIEEIEGK